MELFVSYSELYSLVQQKMSTKVARPIHLDSINANSDRSVHIGLSCPFFHSVPYGAGNMKGTIYVPIADIDFIVLEKQGNALLLQYQISCENDEINTLLQNFLQNFLQNILPISRIGDDKIIVDLSCIKKVRKFLKYNELIDVQVEKDGIHIMGVNKKKQH